MRSPARRSRSWRRWRKWWLKRGKFFSWRAGWGEPSEMSDSRDFEASSPDAHAARLAPLFLIPGDDWFDHHTADPGQRFLQFRKSFFTRIAPDNGPARAGELGTGAGQAG